MTPDPTNSNLFLSAKDKLAAALADARTKAVAAGGVQGLTAGLADDVLYASQDFAEFLGAPQDNSVNLGGSYENWRSGAQEAHPGYYTAGQVAGALAPVGAGAVRGVMKGGPAWKMAQADNLLKRAKEMMGPYKHLVPVDVMQRVQRLTGAAAQMKRAAAMESVGTVALPVGYAAGTVADMRQHNN